LGLIELAVSQGVTTDAIYRLALTANSYWFPEKYARTAQYFSLFANRSWRRVPAPPVLGATFSTLSGWRRTVDARLQQVGIALPYDQRAKAACGL
jgi:hypothetical protein